MRSIDLAQCNMIWMLRKDRARLQVRSDRRQSPMIEGNTVVFILLPKIVYYMVFSEERAANISAAVHVGSINQAAVYKILCGLPIAPKLAPAALANKTPRTRKHHCLGGKWQQERNTAA